MGSVYGVLAVLILKERTTTNSRAIDLIVFFGFAA